MNHASSSPLWRLGFWLPPLLLFVPALAVALLGEPAQIALRYERALLLQEPWRMVVGHWTHLGWRHLLLNGAGLFLVWALVGETLTGWQWLVATLLIGLATSAMLYLGQPQLQWYVGLSGLLHGLLLAGMVPALKRSNPELWLLLAGLLAKLAWEQWQGPLPGSEEAAGGAVVVAAHLYGAVAGALLGCGIALLRWRAGKGADPG